MASSFFGEPTMRSGSTRKSKRSNSDKPKQPQRGLGVAQLEKIRLQCHLGMNYYPGTMPGSYSTSFDQDDVRVQKGYPSTPSPTISYPSSSLHSIPYNFHHGFMVAVSENERNNRYFDHHQPMHRPSWDSNKVETQHFSQSGMTRPFLNTQPEDLKQNRSTNQFNSVRSSSIQNSRSKDAQEIDLELKLSI